jgi:hypothetical protein
MDYEKEYTLSTISNFEFKHAIEKLQNVKVYVEQNLDLLEDLLCTHGIKIHKFKIDLTGVMSKKKSIHNTGVEFRLYLKKEFIVRKVEASIYSNGQYSVYEPFVTPLAINIDEFVAGMNQYF